MTFDEWYADASGRWAQQRVQRLGQFLANDLAARRPETWKVVFLDNPKADPFYDDTRVAEFLEVVIANW